MAYFEDLQPCTLFPSERRNLLAVGWLAKGHEYTRGPVDSELVELLAGMNTWTPPGATRGSHVCDFCEAGDGPRAGKGTLFIPGDGVLYVAPRLIAHYVRKHGYQPPAQFLEALRASPTGLARNRSEPDPRLLDSLDLVRGGPQWFVHSVETGIQELPWPMLALFIREHVYGTSTRLSVDVNERGWVTVEDDGRGISVTPHYGEPWFRTIFSRVSMVPPFPMEPIVTRRVVSHGPVPHALPAATTGLSARLEVETRRDGNAWRMAFASGLLVQQLTNAGPTSRRGTVVRFLPDDEVLTSSARLDLDAFKNRLAGVALLCPKLDVRFQGESLQCPEGLPTWLRQVAPGFVKETLLSASGTVGDFDVEVAFAWRPRASAPLVRSFANYSETVGGSHERGLLSAIEQVIGRKRASRKKKVLSGLVGIVHVGAESPRLNNSSNLDDEAARVAVRDVVTRAINEAPWWWDKLHEAIG